MAETKFWRHGPPEDTKKHFIEFVDNHLPPQNIRDGATETKLKLSQGSEISIYFPANELVIQRWGIYGEARTEKDPRAISLQQFAGRKALKLMLYPNAQVDNVNDQFVVEINENEAGPILKANYVRGILFQLQEDITAGAIVNPSEPGPSGPGDVRVSLV